MLALAYQFELLIKSRGGEIVEDFRHKKQAYISAILPSKTPIKRGDLISGGVILKLDEHKPSLHAFVLRLVCTNGMIEPNIQKEVSTSEEQLEDDLADIIAKFDESKLVRIGNLFRRSQSVPVSDRQIMAVVMKVRRILARNFREGNQITFGELERLQAVQQRMRQLIARDRMRTSTPTDRPESLFDLINSVTDLAHDMGPPQARWELMKLGGEMLGVLDQLSEERQVLLREQAL